jgi:hypothetical protein
MKGAEGSAKLAEGGPGEDSADGSTTLDEDERADAEGMPAEEVLCWVPVRSNGAPEAVPSFLNMFSKEYLLPSFLPAPPLPNDG